MEPALQGKSADLTITAKDFLKHNPRLYAHKARRRKIALISITVQATSQIEEVRIDLGAAKLVFGQNSCGVEAPKRIIRKFSGFTWDFLVFAILDFHPLLVLVDIFFVLTGPLYNRRLKKQLRLLSDSQMVLGPGKCERAVLAFRGVPKGAAQLQLRYRCDGETQKLVVCDICIS